MGLQLARMAGNKPEVRQTPSFVLKQADKARYAFACARGKFSTILSSISYKNFLNINKKEDHSFLGVDITPSCIYVCQIDTGGSGRTLTGLASVCMEGKFVSEDILNNPNIYSESLKKLLNENKIQAKKVAVSLPVSSSIVRVATISKMDDIDIRRAIKYGSMWQNIMSQNDSPDNYSIFYQIIRREAASETMDILLVATKLADISLYKDIITKSGLNPVVVDAKTMALNYAMKHHPSQNFKKGTVLIEFGLENNYIMVVGEDKPRIIDVPLSDVERAMIIGGNANKNPEVVDEIICRYRDIVENIITSYSKIKNAVYIEDIYVSSSLPLISDFIGRLGGELKNCNVLECNIFDHLIIPEDFTINKQSAENNISAWAAAISMAVMPWKNRKEEWIEIRKSPVYGMKYLRHYGKGWKLPDLSIKIGNFDPYSILNIKRKITLASLPSHPNGLALASAVIAAFMMVASYRGLVNENARLSVDDVALSSVVERYTEKAARLASLQEFDMGMKAVQEAALEVSKEENQQYVLSMYSYLDNVLQQGVWLKQLTFTAPYDIEIEGRSVDDNGVTTFLSTLDGSKMFSSMALKHMQSISELDLYAQNSVSLKSFMMRGSLAETLPDAYLHKPSMVAGEINHGS